MKSGKIRFFLSLIYYLLDFFTVYLGIPQKDNEEGMELVATVLIKE